jgi:hypothetical protein
MPITIPSPPSSPRARLEIDEDSIILIENAIKKRTATGLDFVTTDEIKLYLTMKEIPYSLTKQYTKEELINKIIKFKEGTLSPRSLRLQSTRTAGDDVKDFDICNTNKYTKDQIMEYMKNLGIKLPLKYYTKQKLCQILQDNIGKQPVKKVRPIIIEEEEEEIVIKPKKKVTERKYIEEEEEIVVPRRRKISIDELEELEEEAPQIPCGDYENYSDENEFFACHEDQRCDVDRKKCLPKDYKLEEEFKNNYKAVSLDKDGTSVKFIGSPSKLRSLKQRFSDLKNQKQEKKVKEERERLAEKERIIKMEQERRRLEEEQEKFKKEQDKLAEQERIRIEEEQLRLREEQEKIRQQQMRLEEEQIKKKKYEEQIIIQEEQERLKQEQQRIRQEQIELEKQKRAEEKRQQAQKLREEQEEEMRRSEQEKKAKQEEEKRAKRIIEEEKYEEQQEDISDDIEAMIANLEASNVQQRTFKDIREEIQKEMRGETIPSVEEAPKISPKIKPSVAVTSKTAPVPASKLIPRKIPSLKIKEKEPEIKEEEPEIKEEEIEEPVQADIEEVPEVDFSEVRQRLKNIMLDPSVSRVLGGQDFLSIPKKISYCVGLSS